MKKDIIEATRYFIKLVELGSYSAVKKSCYVQVNTIRNKIELLEEYMGLRLIKIDSNRILPTKEGMKFYHSCNKPLNEFERAIGNVKTSGFGQKESIKILGTSMFLKVLINKALPQIQKISNKIENICLDNYVRHNINGNEYKFDSYSIIQIFGSHLKYIDLNNWIICYTVDDMVTPAYLYGRSEFVNKLHNSPENLSNAKMVFRQYDFNMKFVHSEYDSQTYAIDHNNVAYIASTEEQKASILKNDDVIGLMPEYFYDVLIKGDDTLSKVKGFWIEYLVDPHLILVNRNLPYKDEFIDIIRSGVKDLRAKYEPTGNNKFRATVA